MELFENHNKNQPIHISMKSILPYMLLLKKTIPCILMLENIHMDFDTSCGPKIL